MNGKDKLGIAGLVLSLLGGAWLVAAPWIVDYQGRGAEWTTGTQNEFWVGLAVVALSLTALVVFAASALGSLAQTQRETESIAPQE